MTIGGSLVVCCATTEGSKFNVNFARNVKITNFTQREMGEVGDISATVSNGRKGTAERVYSNGRSGKLATLDLSSKRYAIFDALRKLDGNENDLSEKDLAKANSLIGKNGVKAVKRDANAGVTTIVCDDGAVLRFDLETDTEMQARKKQEAVNAQKRKSTEAAKLSKKQKEDAELHEACKSDFEKLCDWFVDKLFH